MVTTLRSGNSCSGEIPNSNDASTSKSDLLAENQALRSKLLRLEADHRAEKDRLRILSGAIKVGYWEWDQTTNRAAYFSEEIAGVLGVSLESLYEIYQCEEDFFQFVHPDDLDHYVGNLSVVLTADHPNDAAHVFDYRVVRPDGNVRYVRELEYGKLERDGVVIRTYGALQDISDHRASSRALAESEQRYSSLFSKLPLGVMEQDWSSIKTAINRLPAKGVKDLRRYFHDNPDMLRELVDTITVTSVNDALLRIYGAETVEEFIEMEQGHDDWWDEEWANLYAIGGMKNGRISMRPKLQPLPALPG